MTVRGLLNLHAVCTTGQIAVSDIGSQIFLHDELSGLQVYLAVRLHLLLM